MKKSLFLIAILLVSAFAQDDQSQGQNEEIVANQTEGDQSTFVERFIASLTMDNLNRLSQKYFYESLAIYGMLLFIIFYQTGKKQNIIMLNDWYDACKNVFESNFSHVGVGKSGDKSLFYQETPAAFKFYASGRETIQFCLVNFEFRKRQDIITNWFFNLIWPEKDRITIDMPLYDQKEPICAAVLRKKDLKTARENYLDLKGLVQKIDTDILDDNHLVLLAGDNYIANTLFDDSTLKLLEQNQKYISLIHITDCQVFSRANSHMRVILNLPTNKKEYPIFEQLMAAMIKIADKLHSVKLPSQSRADAQKEREIYEQIRTKDQREKQQEELRNEKEKKLREERDRISKLGKEELQKYEEKQAQKEKKKLLSKRVQKIM
ncbi:transmembrane protein, putative (macronuclear) [Tetrahymena thermophila SB210]|uniref:Transmembrane protein, putative n=1 Tax=Tetrahymena thermophila (strain SB210) TaxID=312017 RepID=I7M155_TETTS|nr:transmembrane protein, putative [Tetrahymena thermophila SB210]EAR94967.2 transmembrane protein, putative [Tetrahymena thermophila SB210]|eukprot:XP_001015212.2 transmembrane protein, putative [Tetrahymena thermophila SB210]